VLQLSIVVLPELEMGNSCAEPRTLFNLAIIACMHDMMMRIAMLARLYITLQVFG
jgi:hypothetical protein